MAYSRREKSSQKSKKQRLLDALKKQRANPTRTRRQAVSDARAARKAKEPGFRPAKPSKKLTAAEIKKNTAKSKAESKKRGQQTPTAPKFTSAGQRKYKAERISAATRKRTAAIKQKSAMNRVMEGGAGGKYDKNPVMPKAPKLPGGPKAKSKPKASTTKSMKRSTSTYQPASAPKPQTKAQKAYSKDQRNKEYDRLRKAGKTKEAEALGKQIAAAARKNAPKNPFRAPQGAERKDNAYKNVQQLKAMSNFNKGKQINPERGRSFDVPVAKTEKKKNLKGYAA